MFFIFKDISSINTPLLLSAISWLFLSLSEYFAYDFASSFRVLIKVFRFRYAQVSFSFILLSYRNKAIFILFCNSRCSLLVL